MSDYYVDLALSGNGGDGSSGNPWHIQDLIDNSLGELPTGTILYLKGTGTVDGDLDIGSDSNGPLTIDKWGSDPFQLFLNGIGNTLNPSHGSTVKNGIIQCFEVNFNNGGTILNCYISGSTLGVSTPNDNGLLKGCTLSFPSTPGSIYATSPGLLTLIDTIIIGGIDNAEWDCANSTNCVYTNASVPGTGTHTNAQANWTPPALPAWNAARSAFNSAVLSVGINTPPEPGTPPYTGYTVGLWDSARSGIGALDFSTGSWDDTTPQEGFAVYDKSIDRVRLFNGTDWNNKLFSTKAAEISDLTDKPLIVPGDLLVIEDSADSNNKKKVSVNNLTPFKFNAIITPTDLSSDVNDYNPAGLSNANAIIQNATTDVNITGIAGGAAGRFLILHNEGAYSITLKQNSSLSSAINRFDFAGNMDITLIRDQCIVLWYDNVQNNWHNIAQGANQFPTATYMADQLISPIATEYPVSGVNIATLARGSLNNSLSILQFDDTTNEGCAFEIVVPPEALNINLDLIFRAETAPGTPKTVVPALYWRLIPNNLAMPSWSSKKSFLSNLALPATNPYYQYATIKARLVDIGVPRTGNLVQFELIRDAASATDDLVGDFNLKYLKVWFA
jgi:hypothetical protein